LDKDLHAFLRTLPLFSIHSDTEIEHVIAAAKLKSFPAGSLVFDQGDPGDAFHIVYSGRIRIISKENGKEVNLGVLTRGDHFGETSLITANPRNAASRAVEDSVLFTIDRDSFHTYLFGNPRQREYFDKFIHNTSIHRFLKSCTDISSVPPHMLWEIVQCFQPEFFREGEAVVRQGVEPDRMYIIERGKLKVVRRENGDETIINYLHEGNFFGEKALYEKTVRYADVICLTDCHLFSLRKEMFDEITARFSPLRKVIEDRITSYHVTAPPIPYADIIKQELAAYKRTAIESPEKAGETPSPGRGKKTGIRRLASFYRRHVRFPFIRQYDEMSCGSTCLMMIAKYHGKSFSSSRLRDMAQVDLSGSSLADLATAAEDLGFITRGVKLDETTLRDAPLPCIVHWQGFHYIVVYRISDDAVWVADPALGLRKYPKAFFLKSWNGITLTLEPTPRFDAQREDRSPIQNFLPFVTPYRRILLEVFAASLLLNLFGLAMPVFTQNIIDKVIAHGNSSLLNVMALGMILVLIFRVLVSMLREYLIVHTGMRIDLRMLITFYKHLLALPLGYFKVRKIGDFISRFGENLKIRHFMTNVALTLVLDTLFIVVYLSLMFYYNVFLTVLALILIPLFVLAALVFTPLLKRLNIDSFAAGVESQSHLIESINAIDTVKAMNTEYTTRWKWEDKFIRNLNIDFRLAMTAKSFNTVGDFLGTLGTVAILWLGARQVMQSSLSIGELMAFMVLMGNVIAPINRIIMAWDSVQQTLVSVDRLNDVFTAEREFPESVEESPGIVLKEPRGEVVFQDVFFRFGGKDDPYILSNISLKVESGQRVAIVGRSGSGKSTLVKLIARFYPVTEGRVLVDGLDIRSLDLSSLRRTVGFVLQENFMFNGTIRENIAPGDPDSSFWKVVDAAKLANAHDFISGLPMGYETKIGESGLQLSGGQKQRIAIARVLYTNPKIVVFDEATSSLDSESEQAIHQNMDTILARKTAFIIAHRLSTVRNADTIFVLDDGEIVERGSHSDLMAGQGLYHYLVHQQLNL
jgi:ATP-binding cassette subfamily B protein